MGLWLCCLLLPAALRAAEPPSVSTAAAPNPFELDLFYDDRGYNLELDYRLRWDLADVKRLPSTARRWVLHPLDTLGGNVRDIAASARVGFYGFRLKPSRAVVYDGPRSEAPGPAGSGASAGGRRAVVRLDVDPLVEDLRSEVYRGLRRTAIEQGMDMMLPWSRSASYGQKEQIYKDMLDAQRKIREDILE
jgi:hypothetical protein